MNFPWTMVVVAALLWCGTAQATPVVTHSLMAESFAAGAYSEGAIKERLNSLQLPLKANYTDEVRFRIKRYLTNGYRDAQSMLGRTQHYYPIFEHYLELYDLPTELKYLPMVESNLRPYVKSHAGAAGLWQFMPATARQYKLQINGQVDERLDPYRSTEAAVLMLSALYDQFDDWSLALAAYNCGPGCVRSAIRASGSRDFWKLQSYLPQQTQHYVPAFIAAAYVANFYAEHGLNPSYPGQDLRDLRTLRVYDQLRLSEVAAETGVSLRTLGMLNPSYLTGLIPASRTGNYLVLPATALPAWREAFLPLPQAPASRFRSTYVVKRGDQMSSLTALFELSAEDIMSWNNLHEPNVVVGQELVLYLPKEVMRP